MDDSNAYHSFDAVQLVSYTNNQLNHFFPDGVDSERILNKNIGEAIERMQFSLKHVKLQGYTTFDVLHSDLYAQFLYFLSNTIWNNDRDKRTASKLYYLNKALHGLNCMYDTLLPEIFLLIHCVGTVLGKANYSNYFVACHNVTVGSDRGYAPNIREGVYMGPGSSIIGNCTVNEWTHLAINAVVLNHDTESETVAIGSSGTAVTKKLKRNLIKDIYFRFP